MSKVVIDLETGSTDEKAVIFTIGAARYDVSDDNVLTVKEKLYLHVYPIEQLMLGRVTDPDTMHTFWSKQSERSRNQILACDGSADLGGSEITVYHLKEALGKLLEWIRKDDQIFARGPDFESKILASACSDVDMKWVRRYNRMDDVRSYINGFAGTTTGYIDLDNPTFIKHIAIDDCLRDIAEMAKAKRDYDRNTIERFNSRINAGGITGDTVITNTDT